jgi:hypothetical protein
MIAADYLTNGRGSRGTAGAASAVLCDGRELVKFGIEWLERFVKMDPRTARVDSRRATMDDLAPEPLPSLRPV